MIFYRAYQNKKPNSILVTRAGLCRALVISKGALDKCMHEGVLSGAKIEGGYDLLKVVSAYCVYMRKQPEGQLWREEQRRAQRRMPRVEIKEKPESYYACDLKELTCSLSDLVSILGYSGRYIQYLNIKGIVHRVKRGHYHLMKSLQLYLAHIRGSKVLEHSPEPEITAPSNDKRQTHMKFDPPTHPE